MHVVGADGIVPWVRTEPPINQPHVVACIDCADLSRTVCATPQKARLVRNLYQSMRLGHLRPGYPALRLHRRGIYRRAYSPFYETLAPAKKKIYI